MDVSPDLNNEDNNAIYEDSDHESEVEEIEPKLKYSRMGNDLQDILKSDSVSCIAIHPKFVCVGTEWGIIHLLDHQGNNVDKELRAHSVAINQISIDANGDYIASCSDDGRVFVVGLYSSENNHDLMMERLVRSVAIDPFYYKPGSGRRFITGDERLVLHEKAFFPRLSRLKTTVLGDASVEGGVKTMKWSPGGDLLAWASHVGFRVYDLVARASLGLIKWTSKPEVDLKCHICWKDNYNLIVGWADTVRVCTVRKKAVLQPLDVSSYVVQLVFTVQTDYMVCGVGPLDNNLVILGCIKGASNGKSGERPQLQVVLPTSDDYIDLGIDSLSLRGFEQYNASDYSLESLVDEGRFVVVSPRDIAVACPCDDDDRVDWLLKHHKFQTALDAVTDSEKPLKKHSRLTVGRAYIEHLLSLNKFNEAAELCPKILGADKVRWEIELRKFATFHQLRALADYLPTSYDGALPAHNYEIVLYEYLKMDHEGFLQKIKTWPSRLYNLSAVANATMEHILGSEPKSNPTLLEALAVLYSHMGKHDKALSMYIKLQNGGVFELIRQRNLYEMIHTTAKDLMKLDSAQAIDVLLESKSVQPAQIVEALTDNSYYLYLYLDALDKRDTKSCRKYHSLLVKLYADFSKEKLLDLLRKSDHYAIQEALEICQQRKFHEEMVHLLGRIGNTKEALVLILREIKDIERAIAFCKEHDDQDLWEDLINYALDKPEFVALMLKRIGTYVDPRILVQRIANNAEIPHLKEALVKMMQDYNLQVEVQEDYNKILSSDYFDLHERLIATRQRGVFVGEEQYCGHCRRKIFVKNVKDESQESAVIIFNCCHIFHHECLEMDFEYCEICSTTRKHLSVV